MGPTEADKLSERDRLAAAIEAEKYARAKMVMEKIEQICKENNCLFIANPVLVETKTGGWVVSANPGVKPL
jgi:hypothetical protein